MKNHFCAAKIPSEFSGVKNFVFNEYEVAEDLIFCVICGKQPEMAA